jgi:hypothetical protein
MSGIRTSSLLEFFGLLQIACLGEQYMKEDSLNLLADVTADRWEVEMREVRTEVNRHETFDASFDEQHSRPQRFTYGHAPYATCTIMEGDGKILNMSHVDQEVMENSTLVTKAGAKCKSKAKVAHSNSFIFLRDNMTARLRHLTSDQSADGKADAELILRAKWPEFTMNFDLWHKIYPMTADFKKFVTTRTHKRGPFKYPRLHALWESKQLGAHTFKKWWINCSETCGGDGEVFKAKWLGAAKHLVNRFWEESDSESSSESEEPEESDSESSMGPRWEIDQLLEAKWTDGEYYYGKVTKVFANGSYSFRFDDGDFGRSILEKHIRERTPIVPFGQADLEDSESESEEEDVEEGESSDDEIEVEGEFDSRKYNLDALTTFLTQQMKNYEYFLNGTTTSYGESFHSICNLYYPKGSTVAFQTYVMKKTFAGLHWQELRDRMTLCFMRVSLFTCLFLSCNFYWFLFLLYANI